MGNQIRRYCIALALLACIASASAQKYPIVKLTASGSERYLAEDILHYTGLAENKSVDVPLAAVQAAAEKLNASGAFAEVKYQHTIAPGGMKVEFTLVDKDDDQFVPCEFDNVVWLPEAELATELHNRVPLYNGTVPREGGMTDDVVAALQGLLKQRGVETNIVSSLQEPTNTGSSETVQFRAVDLEVKVARFAVSGASSGLARELDAEGKRMIGLTYNRGTLNKFIEKNLRSVYLKRGYLRASFASPVIDVLPAAPAGNSALVEVAISVPVMEGLAYRLGAMQWTGNKAVSAADLQSSLRAAPGQTVDGSALSRGENAIRAQYARLGYLHMLLTSEPTFDDAAHTVNYKYTVNEGDLFRMGKLEVEGRQPSAAAKIHLAWKLREGDPFDASYVRTFVADLKATANAPFIVEESEGEHAKTVDLTLIFCTSNQPCRPTAENHLFSAQDAEQEIKP
ncbi:MAG: hypothetical protein JWO13_1543 [Acidobacteriales bacterium]|nr:hypothetical protein [Terriglobales bacterium]